MVFSMAISREELLSTEIENRGVADTGPYAGSMSFTVRVRRRLPDFLSSVNLKYVKLGCSYVLGHGFYLLTAPIMILIVSVGVGRLNWQALFHIYECDPTDGVFVVGFFGLIVYFSFRFFPRSTYLVDFACYRPLEELKISKEEFITLATRSGQFNGAAIEFQRRVLKSSGIGDETYMPRSCFRGNNKITLKDGREEASLVMFGAIDDLIATTKVRPKDIRILVVNCGILNTTPSLSSMVVNHYKLRHDILSFNLGGMGCAAGITAIDIAQDLLNANPGCIALVVSTEVVCYTWYSGNEKDMLIPNCFFRMGAAAVVLSSRRLDRWRSKYELKQLVGTHKGTDDRSFKSIRTREDREGNRGLSVSQDVIEIGGHALKANITTLSPLVLPVSEQLHFFRNLLFKKRMKPYLPDYKLAFNHICIQAASKKVLDELQSNLELIEDYMEPSRKTLERFGNTSSSSVWYELAYLEAHSKVKKGDRIWQIAFGSGFKCNSAVWKALQTVKKPTRNPWIEDSV